MRHLSSATQSSRCTFSRQLTRSHRSATPQPWRPHRGTGALLQPLVLVPKPIFRRIGQLAAVHRHSPTAASEGNPAMEGSERVQVVLPPAMCAEAAATGTAAAAAATTTQAASAHAEYARRLAAFLARYGWLADFFAVDFLTTDYWTSVFPPDWALALEQAPLATLCRTVADGHVESHWPQTLQDFVRLASDLALPRSPASSLYHDALFANAHLDKDIAIGMNPKKLQEVTSTASLISHIAQQTGSSHVLDLGAGQGYLSSALALQYGLNTYAVDKSQSQVDGAQRRADNIRRLRAHHDKQRQRQSTAAPSGSLRFIVDHVRDSDGLSYVDMIREIEDEYEDARDARGWIVCGLHTCGDLASTMVRSFVRQQGHVSDVRVAALVNLGCCYQILSENDPTDPNRTEHAGFPMSETVKSLNVHLGLNMRMVACQATQRWTTTSLESTQQTIRKLYYRSVLQKMLHDLRLRSAQPSDADTRFSETNRGEVAIRTLPESAMATPETYVRAALARLGIPQDTVGDGTVAAYFEWHSAAQHQIAVVWSMRTLLADAAESLILMDRLLYVGECSACRVVLTPVVDATVSPRNMALVAISAAACT
ncbi:methyltransferase domain-containing protein [Entophlyctis helioformis]|nr:methyltransferase domain-containing protein [Entophlyctis helioformis]